MKVLLVSDVEEKRLWDNWSDRTVESLSDVRLVLSAGDLDPNYLEFLVTMLNVPLVYVRGNHDGRYEAEPPGGCIDADGRIVEVECSPAADAGGAAGPGDRRVVRIAGLGGSMRYKKSDNMYTERQMAGRVRAIERSILTRNLKDGLLGNQDPDRPAFDILLTHAPACGYGDLDDLPHSGFECFNTLLDKYRPQLHCYGHVHKEYIGAMAGISEGRETRGYHRTLQHPSGALLVNAHGHYILEI